MTYFDETVERLERMGYSRKAAEFAAAGRYQSVAEARRQAEEDEAQRLREAAAGGSGLTYDQAVTNLAEAGRVMLHMTPERARAFAEGNAASKRNHLGEAAAIREIVKITEAIRSGV